MSSEGDLEQVAARLSSERDRLLNARKPRTKRDLKAERQVSKRLPIVEHEIGQLELELLALDKNLPSWKRTSGQKRLRLFNLICVVITPIPLLIGYLMTSDQTVWTETTCSVIEYESYDGGSAYEVSPALRPDWHFPGSQSGPCWIPEPPTPKHMGLFVRPETDAVPRLAQIGNTPRVLSVLFLILTYALWAAGHLGTPRRPSYY